MSKQIKRGNSNEYRSRFDRIFRPKSPCVITINGKVIDPEKLKKDKEIKKKSCN